MVVYLASPYIKVPIGGAFVASKEMGEPNLWFPENGVPSKLFFADKIVLSFSKGGGLYLVDLKKFTFCCIAEHHYALSRTDGNSLVVLLSGELISTNLESVLTWKIPTTVWIDIELNTELDEATLKVLWEEFRKETPGKSENLIFAQMTYWQ